MTEPIELHRYLVTFAIRTTHPNWHKVGPAVTEQIREIGSWCCHLDNAVFLITTLTANEVLEKLRPLLHEGDDILIARLDGPVAYRMKSCGPEGERWIDTYIRRNK